MKLLLKRVLLFRVEDTGVTDVVEVESDNLFTKRVSAKTRPVPLGAVNVRSK